MIRKRNKRSISFYIAKISIITILIAIFVNCGNKKSDFSDRVDKQSTNVQTIKNESSTDKEPTIIGLKIFLKPIDYSGVPCDILGAKNGDIVVSCGGHLFDNSGQLWNLPRSWEEDSWDNGYTLIRGQDIIRTPAKGRAWDYEYDRIEEVPIRGHLAAQILKSHKRRDTDKLIFYAGFENRIRAALPSFFPKDPLDDHFYILQKPTINRGRRGERQYVASYIRYLKNIEARQLAQQRANNWLDGYIRYFVNNGFIITARDSEELMGPWIRWGVTLVNYLPDREKCVNSSAVIQILDIESGIGQAVWHKINYSEILSDDVRERKAFADIKEIAADKHLSDSERRRKLRVVQDNFGNEVFTSIMRLVPIYDADKEKIYTFDSYMRELSQESGTYGTSPIEKDPIGAGMKIFFDPSPETIKSMFDIKY